MKGCAQRLVLKQRQKETFIHELLTGAFDYYATIISFSYILYLALLGHCQLIPFPSINSLQMLFNQTYVPEEASARVNNPMEQIHYNQVLLKHSSPFPDFPPTWETLLQSESAQMQFNQTYVPDEASVQVNKPMDQMHYSEVLLQRCSPLPDCSAALQTLVQRESVEMQFNQTYAKKPTDQIHCNHVLPQNCSAIPDCSTIWDNLLHGESVEEFQQKTKQTMSNLYSKGNRSSRMSLNNRRKRNREREHKRQTRLKEAFNVLRSVIPDYFSEREPEGTLSRIQTLRLAKKYIATLHELLETC